MNTSTISHQHSAAPSWKVAALIACALAVGLLAWRGQAVFTAPAPDAMQEVNTYSANELTVFNLVEPIVGAENVRVAVAPFDDGSRIVTVLLNEPASEKLAAVHELAMRALSIQAARGDKLTVEVVEFSAATGQQLGNAEYFELCGLALLVALTAWIGLRPHRVASATAKLGPSHATSEMPRPAEVLMPRESVGTVDADPIANVAKTDPAGAARVIRGWMSHEGAS